MLTVARAAILCMVVAVPLTFSGISFAEVAMYFQKSDAEASLESAIQRDDAAGVAMAISKGANVNTIGKQGVTPLAFAVGKMKTHAVAELLRNKARADLRDVEGDNAVTLAASAYKKSPVLLEMLLNAGADPNTPLPNGNPLIVRFLNDHNLDAVRYLHSKGANVDAKDRAGEPLVIHYGTTQDWDSLYTLLSLGAKFSYPNEATSWRNIFSTPSTTSPDSPLWGYKVKVWRFLKQQNQDVPARIEDLVDQDYWDYLAKKGLPRKPLE